MKQQGHGPTNIVPFGRNRRMPDPARVAEFAATARRLQREREESAFIVARLLRETPREEWQMLASRPELQTSGALERLATLAENLERDPNESLALTELATRIADALPNDSYPRVVVAQLRAHAWKDRGRALSYVARYDEALEALDRADRSLNGFGTLAHDQAIVDFVRSIVLQHLRRFDEAQVLLRRCRDVFHDHADTRLYRKCSVAAGNLLSRRGDHRAAREVFAAVLIDAEADLDSAARAHSGIAACALHLGLADEALRHFDEAAEAHRKAGAELEAVRAGYGAGCALLRLGRARAAVERLTLAREQFLEHRLVEEAGLAGLEIVEARVLLGESEPAQLLASRIVSEFAAASLNRRAVAALAYLNDAIAASRATAAVVRNVSSYIATLRSDPTVEFTAIN